MNFKKTLIMILVGLLVLGTFAGCTPAEKEDKAAEEAETIKIGAITPKTGDVAVYGLAVEKGYNLAIKKYNEEGGILGKKIDLIVYDNKGDNTETINAYNKLVSNDKVSAILGAVISANSLTIAPSASEDGIPMLTPASTNWDVTLAGENVFRSCYTDPFQGGKVAEFAVEDLEAKTAAVMYDTANDYGVGLAEAFKEAFESAGGTIVNYEGFVAEDKDYKAVLTNIKNNNPDVLFIPDYYNTVALVGQQAKEIGLEATLLGGDGWDGILTVDPAAVEGGYFVNHYSIDDPDTTIQDFVAAYKAEYDEETPNAFAALGYDAARTMIEAIKSAESTESDAIIEALKNTDLNLVTGHTIFDENRNPVKEISVLQVENGKYKFIGKK